MGNHDGPTKALTSPRKQGDGRKYLPHTVTAIVSILLSLGVAHATDIGGHSTTTNITQAVKGEGFCAYFGPDGSGHTRFQVSAPTNGFCAKGSFVSVASGR